MNVVTLASRKGGAGKSTLTAHLAACAHGAGHRCLVIDADPQGSLTLWHSLRADGQPALQSAERGIERAVTFAAIEGYQWIFIDTAPSMWVVVQEAMRASTLVLIPARSGAGGSACESAPDSTAAAEIRGLWSAVRRSVEAVNAARPRHGQAA